MKRLLLGLLAAPKLLVSNAAKASIAILLALAAFSASAFTKQECSIAAQNVYYAQLGLNDDPAEVQRLTEEIKKTPAVEYGMTEELKAFIVGIVERLKQGSDAVEVANGIFDACKSIKGT